MFKKLLKYDLKSLLSIWWIGAVSLLVLAIPTGLCAKTLITVNYLPYVDTFCELWIFIYYILLSAFSLFGTVLLFIRYYSNFFRDEGYLTFTLPVKRSSLYLSKVLSGTIVNILSTLTVIASVCIILAITPDSKSDPTPILFEIVPDLIKGFIELIKMDGFRVLSFLLFFLIICVLYAVLSVTVLYLFITIGSTIVKKHKLVATIGLMYGASFVSSMVLIPGFILVTIWFSSVDYLFANGITENVSFALIMLVMALIIAALTTVISLISLATTGTLERKLNLQ